MEKQVTDSILEKIQKCLALSNNPNENEAKVAAQRVQELLLKYNLSMEDILDPSEKEKITEEIKQGSCNYTAKWEMLLLNTITQHYFCKLLIRGNGKYSIIGRLSNTKTAVSMFDYLSQASVRLANSKIKQGSKDAFKIGFARGIEERLEAIRKEQEQNGIKETNCTAVMVVNLKDKMNKENDQYMRSKYRNLGTYRTSANRNFDHQSYARGIEASKSVSLNTQIQ